MKTIQKVAIALMVVLGLVLSSGTVASAATPSSNPATWNWPTFQQNATAIRYQILDVRTIQYLLNARGAGLVVDGIFGPRTTAAVKSFQRSHGLVADGIVGKKTWAALIITVRFGDRGLAVRAAQDQLASSRVPSLKVDGLFGRETSGVVLYFQGRMYPLIHKSPPIFDTSVPWNNFTVDGIVGPLTWFSLVAGYLSAG